jgi:hypothetical protein
MPGWIPRWHPFIWAAVIIMIYLIWTQPAEWGAKAGGILHMVPVAAGRFGIFLSHI